MIPSILPTYARAPLEIDHAKGCWLTDTDGRQFLDFVSGIAVNALGHANPRLIAALTGQAERIWHCSNLYQIPQQQALADRLVALTFADTAFFTNSGTESCELAVKMVRRHFHASGTPGRQTILTFEGAFHGRSMAAISAAGSAKMTDGFAPLLPGFVQLPWGDRAALEAAVDETTAAIMLEPIQGEGGIRPMPAEDLQAIRALCDARGILLVLDEVQCGMGRTGRLFAHEWAGITPDIMLVAKGIGGGFPIGAVLATEAAAAAMTTGTHGSTYGGNPLGCAVAGAVLDAITEPGFLDTVQARGAYLARGLAALAADHGDLFHGTRGRGLMQGLICAVPSADVVNAAFEAGMLLVGAADNVVRVLPPLNVTEAEIDTGLDRLAEAAQALRAKAG